MYCAHTSCVDEIKTARTETRLLCVCVRLVGGRSRGKGSITGYIRRQAAARDTHQHTYILTESCNIARVASIDRVSSPITMVGLRVLCGILRLWPSSSSTKETETSLIEEAKHLASGLLPPRLFMVKDTDARCQDEFPELPRRQQPAHPRLDFVGSDIIARTASQWHCI